MQEYIIDSSNQKRKAVRSTCLYCKKEFLHRSRKTQPKYCSKICFIENNNKNKRTNCKCSNCFKEFKKKNSSLKNSKSGLFFCSKLCKDTAQRIGGVKEIMPPHYSDAKKDIQLSFFNNTERSIECCDCKEEKRYLLCCHHIDGNRQNNTLDNVEIVCYNCHVKRHLENKNGEWTFNTKKLTPRDIIKNL